MPPILRRLLASLLLCLLSLPALASPPLYKVQAGAATLYLFGTFHALPDQPAAWQTSTLRSALDKAGTVIFEIHPATMAGPQAQATALKRGLVFDDMTLDKRLPPDLYERYIKTMGGFGLPAEGLRKLQPWLAALTLTQLQIRAQGFDPDKGAELQLYQAINRSRAEIMGLETVERQIGFFADMPMDQQVEMVRESLDELAQSQALLEQMKGAWLAGDETALEALLNARLKAYPELYDVLMRQRNAAWMPLLRNRLAAGGTTLVAVGTAHLIGDDSVVALLRKAGYKVERVTH